MTLPAATPEEMALANSIADETNPTSDSEWIFARAGALAAIRETSERAAKFVRNDDGRHMHRVTARQIEKGEHLK